ncbi:MAG: NAD-dependent epimerase/dehydratase family protein [Planctomycetota bacterium]|nr:NAD-dependent epimerase/dehydratase family protein [Planctomycetota bacterium]
MSASAVVTGGAGFIGAHLVEALVRDGVRVIVLDDFSSGLRSNLAAVVDRIEVVEGGVEDPEACDRAVTAAGDAGVVYHLASRVSVVESMEKPDLYRAVVLDGTRHVLSAAERTGCRRVVLASSCSVYGDASPPVGESGMLDPQSPYAALKAEAEAACLEANVETVCPRFFNVYGPRQRADSPYSGVIAIFAQLAADGVAPTIFGDGEQTRDFIHVSDIVRGLRLAGNSDRVGAGEPINFGTGRGTSVATLARLLGCGEPRHEAAREGEIRHSWASTSAALRLLGFDSKIDLERGLSTLD